jgi:hypothetical protein
VGTGSSELIRTGSCRNLCLYVLIQAGSSFIETEEFTLGSECTYWSLLFYIFVMTLYQLQSMLQFMLFVSGLMHDDVIVVWKDASAMCVRV